MVLWSLGLTPITWHLGRFYGLTRWLAAPR